MSTKAHKIKRKICIIIEKSPGRLSRSIQILYHVYRFYAFGFCTENTADQITKFSVDEQQKNSWQHKRSMIKIKGNITMGVIKIQNLAFAAFKSFWAGTCDTSISNVPIMILQNLLVRQNV